MHFTSGQIICSCYSVLVFCFVQVGNWGADGSCDMSRDMSSRPTGLARKDTTSSDLLLT